MKKQLRLLNICLFNLMLSVGTPIQSMEDQTQATPLAEFKELIDHFHETGLMEMLKFAYDIYGKLENSDKRLAEIYAEQSDIKIPTADLPSLKLLSEQAVIENKQLLTLEDFLSLLGNISVDNNDDMCLLVARYHDLSQEDQNQADVFLEAQFESTIARIIKQKSSIGLLYKISRTATPNSIAKRTSGFREALRNFNRSRSVECGIELLQCLGKMPLLKKESLQATYNALKDLELDTSEVSLNNIENKLARLVRYSDQKDRKQNSKRKSW